MKKMGTHCAYLFHACCMKSRRATDGFYHVYSPHVMKVCSQAGSVLSGASTPGGGVFKNLSEGDLGTRKPECHPLHSTSNQEGGSEAFCSVQETEGRGKTKCCLSFLGCLTKSCASVRRLSHYNLTTTCSCQRKSTPHPKRWLILISTSLVFWRHMHAWNGWSSPYFPYPFYLYNLA